MYRHTGPDDISKSTVLTRVQSNPCRSVSMTATTRSMVDQQDESRNSSPQPVPGLQSLVPTGSQGNPIRSMVDIQDESRNSSPQPVPGFQSLVPAGSQGNPTRSESMTPTRFETATRSMVVQLDESWNIIPLSVPEDNKPSRDPRDWTYDQVVGELCRMERRLLYKDLGPLLDKKVAGDVLLSCSLEVLLTVLELDFNTAIRVTDQIDKLKMVVRGLDEIVIK
eukprot:GFUD01115876.1.p1 GENE.GFUD01115876.1~~GFUD01115876.1.p1  ORF type:complete len:223 (+),score=70.93 GFUD01115876.1:72-740(+)